jgi:hypothetical protein
MSISEHPSLAQLSTSVFGLLRQMDAEATTQWQYKGNLFPTGLRAYAMHEAAVKGLKKKRYDWEVATARRLGELLAHNHPEISIENPPAYPRSGRKADLLISIKDFGLLWLEAKAALKYDREIPSVYVPNGWYAKHLKSTTENSASNDFRKLTEELSGLPNTFGAVLLLGFDNADEPSLRITDNDIAAMKQNGAVDPSWEEFYSEWNDVHQAGDVARHGIRGRFRVRCWFWLRRM